MFFLVFGWKSPKMSKINKKGISTSFWVYALLKAGQNTQKTLIVAQYPGHNLPEPASRALSTPHPIIIPPGLMNCVPNHLSVYRRDFPTPTSPSVQLETHNELIKYIKKFGFLRRVRLVSAIIGPTRQARQELPISTALKAAPAIVAITIPNKFEQNTLP